MKRLNDYFVPTGVDKETEHRISLCGKLEAIIGDYFLAGAGSPDEDIYTLYHDPDIRLGDEGPLVSERFFSHLLGGVRLVPENIVAYILKNEMVAFVREDMAAKVKQDTAEYGLVCIPVASFEADEFFIDTDAEIPGWLKRIVWADDDFLNDAGIAFDFDAFEVIDSGVKYVNPKHFSVLDFIGAL